MMVMQKDQRPHSSSIPENVTKGYAEGVRGLGGVEAEERAVTPETVIHYVNPQPAF